MAAHQTIGKQIIGETTIFSFGTYTVGTSLVILVGGFGFKKEW